MATARRPVRAVRIALALAFALMASVVAVLTMPRPVLACSCVGFNTLKEAATPGTAVFTGTAGLRQARGVPVEVERWFFGGGAAPIVWLSGQSFGDSAACGVNPPPPGSSWLWVAWRGDDGTFGTGLCSLSGNLASPEGQAMLAEAVTAFGEAPAPPEETATPTSEAALPTRAAAIPTPVAGPADVARDQTALTVLGVLLLGSLILSAGIGFVARLSSRGERR